MTIATDQLSHPSLPTDEQIMNAFNRGVRTALLEHKRAGVPIVVWRDGKIVHIPAEEIEIPDLDNSLAQAPDSSR